MSGPTRREILGAAIASGAIAACRPARRPGPATRPPIRALHYAVRALDVPLSAADQRAAMQTYLELPAWPDAPAALARLRDAGFRLAFLSNFTAAMLEACAARAGVGELFERALSTEAARSYKPAQSAYRLGPRALELPSIRSASSPSRRGTPPVRPGSATRPSGSTAPKLPPRSSASRPASWQT